LGRDNIEKTVVFIVCGGYKVSLEEMAEYRAIAEKELKDGRPWMVDVDGQTLVFPKP
jgi:L-serine/L-threonine ammonia-lyase